MLEMRPKSTNTSVLVFHDSQSTASEFPKGATNRQTKTFTWGESKKKKQFYSLAF